MPNTSEAAADRLLAAVLRGEAGGISDVEPAILADRVAYHGIAGLVADRVGSWPAEAARAAMSQARFRAVWEMKHRLVLSDLLGALEAAGVRVLLLKGTALAYDLYASPAARARGDSDLLVGAADVRRTREVLSARGFAHPKGDPAAIEGVRLQESWRLAGPDGLVHEVDLHWSALNSPALADAVRFEDGWARSRPLPGLGPHARGLPLDLALLVACAHRGQHAINPYFVGDRAHYGGDRLIWLWDIHLLVRGLDAGAWSGFLDACRATGLGPVARQALAEADRLFGGSPPPEVMDGLAAMPADSPAARYLLAGHRMGRALADLRSARSGAGRLGYLWGQLFPPEEFMRGRYPDGPERPLLVLHWRRITRFLRPGPDRRS